MNKREEIQQQIIKTGLEEKDLIVDVSIRIGKTRCGIQIIEPGDSVLIAYPFKSIKESWLAEMLEVPPKSIDITFTTQRSLKKHEGKHYDCLIVDEPQYLSEAQITSLGKISYGKRIGLTGTLSSETKQALEEKLKWYVKFKYDISDAIRDGIVKDYRINIHMVEMDSVNKTIPYTHFKTDKIGTEVEVYEYYSNSMEYFKQKMESSDSKAERAKAQMGFKKYMGLRTNLIYNSKTVYDKAKALINQYKDEKVLIYTLRTDIADSLSDVTYHSKNKEDEVIETFKNSESGHCAVVNCVQAGVTIRNLYRVIFHTYESNTETLHQKLGRSLLYEFNGKASNIDVVCLKDTQMEKWIDSGVKSLEQDKIVYMMGDMEFSKGQWLKFKYSGKELYYYNDSLCYYSHTDERGFKQYRFVETPNKLYSLREDKLQPI